MQNATPNPAATTAESTNPNNGYDTVERRLAAAYSDCHSHHAGGYEPGRNLDFCCPFTVSLPEAIRLLQRYVPGYNAFDPAALKALPSRCRVRLAREGSVCLYVETRVRLDEKTLRQKMECDEFGLCLKSGQTYIYRVWWD